MIRAAALLVMAGTTGCTAAASADPAPRDGRQLPRVVSINPCVDAVLMQVADARQIAGISHYSHDPQASSIAHTLAMRFNATSGTAEEVVALAPDLVIAGAHVAPATIAALNRLKIPLLQIGVAESIAESNAQVRQIATAVGHADRGEALVAQTMASVQAAKGRGAPIPALIWQGGGLVPGDDTLADELLTVTGFRNLSADYGLKQWDVLPLEYIVGRPPRVLLSVGADAKDDRMLGHRVLRKMKTRIAIRAYDRRLMQCAGPTIGAAVHRLATIRHSL